MPFEVKVILWISALLEHDCECKCWLQQSKDASKKEKLAKELQVAAAQEELKLSQLQRAQDRLIQKGVSHKHAVAMPQPQP